MNIERMMRIYDFLVAPESLGGVPRSDFDMNTIVDGPPEELGHHCESRACVIGFFPHIFPETFSYGPEFGVKNRVSGRGWHFELVEFLMCDSDRLFCERFEKKKNTPAAAAADIRAFIEKKLKGEK